MDPDYQGAPLYPNRPLSVPSISLILSHAFPFLTQSSTGRVSGAWRTLPGCCHKGPQTTWLKQQKFVLSQFWKPEARTLKSRCRQDGLPSENCGEESFLSSPSACGGGWNLGRLRLESRHSRLFSHPHGASPVCLCPHFPFLIRMRSTLIPYDFILT